MRRFGSLSPCWATAECPAPSAADQPSAAGPSPSAANSSRARARAGTPGGARSDRGARPLAIARQFRQAFGPSPDAYRTSRRLALALTAIEGLSPARVAAETGFADRNHRTRQFTRPAA